MGMENNFFFAQNNGKIQAPCEYALIQPQYQVHFYQYRVIFYLTKDAVAADRIVLKLTNCPEAKLVAKDPVDDTATTFRSLHYYGVCKGVDIEFALEDGMLVQKVIVSENSCIEQLHLEFEGQKQVILADSETIRLEGLHECFQYKCPCAKSVIDHN